MSLSAAPLTPRPDRIQVYVVYFKTNKKRIADYPNMLNYCRELYQMPAVRATIDMEHIKVAHLPPLRPSFITSPHLTLSRSLCCPVRSDPLLHLAPKVEPVRRHPRWPQRSERVQPAARPRIQVSAR